MDVVKVKNGWFWDIKGVFSLKIMTFSSKLCLNFEISFIKYCKTLNTAIFDKFKFQGNYCVKIGFQ